MKFAPSKAIEVSSQNPVVAIGIPEGSRTIPSGLTRAPYRSVLVPTGSPARRQEGSGAESDRRARWPLGEVETETRPGPARFRPGSREPRTRPAGRTSPRRRGRHRRRKRPRPSAAGRLPEADADSIRVEHLARWVTRAAWGPSAGRTASRRRGSAGRRTRRRAYSSSTVVEIGIPVGSRISPSRLTRVP
jgi:hypothetical protein